MPSTIKQTNRQRLFANAQKVKTRRILQVITPSHMSGAEMQLVRLTKRMTARGHAMPVLVKSGSPAISEMEHLGMDVDVARIGGKVNVAAPALIAQAAKRHRVDIVQSTLSSASWWCGWMETFGGPKSIGHVQGFTSAKWHSKQTHLLCVSNAIKQHMVDQGISPAKITVLYNALEQDEFVPTRTPLEVRKEFGADAQTPVIGTFGHLSVKKGYRELFDAIPRILKLFPTTQFWVMGTGKLREELETKAHNEGFLENVRFNGFRRDTADLMNAIDVMALPSHREPCALVYIEAALSARPIVGCNAGGSPESIANGETGLLVPVGDGPAVAEAILTLLDNREFARKMGEAGRERARDVFSWGRFTSTLEGVYERVLG